ncbi:MAG: hypothetical protein EPN39_10625 [Chitinophagaceae bacterium]|nr:MAG: hypothetical protein EPN39_10625 [Chitinophagaceae bacterium]
MRINFETIMWKIYLFLLCIGLLYPISSRAQDLALHKPYTLSALPNYPLSAPSTDKTSLTDGIYTSPGNFWTKSTTVGWEHRQVTITIDLGTIASIGTVTFNTAGYSKAHVFFPKAVFIFISEDNKRYFYVGNAVAVNGNEPEDYEVKKFSLKSIDRKARYIKLTVIPNGWFIFCDEIEVSKGANTVHSNSAGVIPLNHLEYAVDSLMKPLSSSKEYIEHLIANRDKIGVINSDLPENPIEDLQSEIENNYPVNNLNNLKIQIGKQYASELSKIFNVPFVIEKCNPWAPLNELHRPAGMTKNLNYDFLTRVKGVQYGAFIITNTSTLPLQFNIKTENINKLINDIEIYKVPFVKTANHDRIPDPIIPLTSDINIDPGFCEMFIFKLKGLGAGTNDLQIEIQSQGESFILNIKSRVININEPENCNLDADNWAYLYYPMLTDRKEIAVSDLQTHHVNTLVIPPAFLPRIGTSNYQSFINYLSYFKNTGIKNILLLMNYASEENRNGANGQRFMSSSWQQSFLAWYRDITRIIKDNGFAAAKVYLYPYDEIRDNDIDDFKQLMVWAKKAIPEVQFFATLTNSNNVNNILPLVDIGQIIANYPGFNNLPLHRAEVWIYKVNGTARSLSPYSYYRLMAWDAFLHNYTGIGFWDYAEENSGAALNLVTGPNVNPIENYSVIYDGPGNSIISSRRWEAFSRGIEDYKLLCLYSQKNGIEKAKVLAKMVLDNTKDINMADTVIKKILQSLQAM